MVPPIRPTLAARVAIAHPRFAAFHPIMKRPCQLFLCLILIVACGRNESPVILQLSPAVSATLVAATSVSGQAVQSLAATPRNKFEYETQVAIALATETLLPFPTAIPMTFPPSQPLNLPLGFQDDCYNSGLRGFHPTNCWTGKLANGDYMDIYAGNSESDVNKGTLWVFWSEPTGSLREDKPQSYMLPIIPGPMVINQVNYPLVLIAIDQIQVTFNLETRQWVTANGTPIPTPTTTLLLPTAAPDG